MRVVAIVRALGAIDARSIVRDPMLRWVVLLTPLFGLFLRFAAPFMTDALRARVGFDLVPYYPLVMSLLPVAIAAMIGTVVGFLLLDQRDDQTLLALLVTPLSLGAYLRYRLVGTLLVSAMISAVSLPLAGLADTTITQVIVTAVATAPLAPVYALFLGAFAENKVQGFALAKVLGIVIVPCIAAYSVSPQWQPLFGLLPHYWPLKTYWLFHAGAAVAALVHAVIGLLWQGVVLSALLARFARVARQ